ncbi:MAG: helix-turn-helix transcriptional regulator [Saprospiraceae bacterium]
MIYWSFAVCFGFLTFLGLSLLIRRMSCGFRFLGVYFLVEGYVLYTTYLIYSRLIIEHPHFFKTGSPLMYLYGPLYYFFITGVFTPNYRFRLMDLAHLLPFVLHTAELWPYWILSGAEKTVLFQAFINEGPMHADWGILTFREHAILKSVLVIGYSVAGFFKMRPAVGSLRRLFANWKKRMLQAFLVFDFFLRVGVFGMITLVYLLYWLLPYYFVYFGDAAFFIDAVLAAFFILLYPGFVAESDLVGELSAYGGQNSFSGEGKSEEPPKKTQAQASFDTDLYEIFEEHYSDPELSIGKLASLLNLSERQLFRKAKESMGKSPVELLLSFRLEKAREVILAHPKKAIGQILTESGFNNKSYFSRRFLEYYGVSPRELRKSAGTDRPEINPD